MGSATKKVKKEAKRQWAKGDVRTAAAIGATALTAGLAAPLLVGAPLPMVPGVLGASVSAPAAYAGAAGAVVGAEAKESFDEPFARAQNADPYDEGLEDGPDEVGVQSEEVRARRRRRRQQEAFALSQGRQGTILGGSGPTTTQPTTGQKTILGS